VLEAPEQDYAHGPAVPRRTSAAPRRKLRRDLSEDFADDFPDDEDAPASRRQRGVRLRLRWGLPKTKWGRIAVALGLVLAAGSCAGALWLAREMVMHDPRFFISSASSIEIQGNQHLTRGELVNIFGQDVERNIFHVSLAERRAQLERLPWVRQATVMRLLPDRLRVLIVERTPVAFVRQGSRIGLVDADGVLLDMPLHGEGNAHYSFPVVTGILAGDPISTRAARMKIFERFTAELDSSGEKISQKLSEVDLSNPEDVRALIPDQGKDVLVHFGDTDFLNRYRRYEEHLAEWRSQYPALWSVDMRYERQVVLEMQPGSAGASDTSAAATGAAAAAGAAPVSPPAAVTPAKKDAAKKPASRTHAPAAKHGAAKARSRKATVKAHPHVARPAEESSHYHSSQAVHP
jgi:cell division protein FtsQ